MEVARELGRIYGDKINHENLYNDNLNGGSGFAADYHLDSGFGPTLGATSTMKPIVDSSNSDCCDDMNGEGKRKYKRKTKGKGVSAGGLSAGGMSAGGESAGAKPKRKARKKGGDFNDILDGVSKVASTAKDVAEAVAPVAGVIAPLLALGKPKRKPRKKGGASLENPSREPYREGGQSDIPSAPIAYLAPSANKAPVLEQPVEKSQMPGVSVGGAKKKRTITAKMQRRNELIKKIMKDRKCSLPEASKIISKEKLEY